MGTLRCQENTVRCTLSGVAQSGQSFKIRLFVRERNKGEGKKGRKREREDEGREVRREKQKKRKKERTTFPLLIHLLIPRPKDNSRGWDWAKPGAKNPIQLSHRSKVTGTPKEQSRRSCECPKQKLKPAVPQNPKRSSWRRQLDQMSAILSPTLTNYTLLTTPNLE